MKHIVFEIESNDDILELIDKRFDHFFIHKFNPHNTIEWYSADLKTANFDFKGATIRNMELDLQTNLDGLKKLIDLNTNYLRIYQFEKSVPDTLLIEHLPENTIEKILLQNGLRHLFFIDFEFLILSSFDEEYIDMIKNHPVFGSRIKERRLTKNI